MVRSSGAVYSHVKPVSVYWFYKVEATITVHHHTFVAVSHITAWSQGRPLLPALRNSGRFLTIPLRGTSNEADFWHIINISEFWFKASIEMDEM